MNYRERGRRAWTIPSWRDVDRAYWSGVAVGVFAGLVAVAVVFGLLRG